MTDQKFSAEDGERRTWYEKGRLFKREGDISNAIVCFQTMLQQNSEDLLALNELYKCYLLEDRLQEAGDTVNKLVGIYVKEDKQAEALTVYGDLQQKEPKHCFEPDVQAQIIGWLLDVEDFSGMVIASVNYADRYPHNKKSASILLNAAQVAAEKLDDQEQTKTICDRISESYPDTKAAETAAALFFENFGK